MIQPWEHNQSRAIRLRHAAATRAYHWLARKKLLRHRPGMHYHVNAHPLAIHRLPHQLSRLRICHLTDMHVGAILTPKFLPQIVDAVNDAEADIIAVTGDMIDDSSKFIEPVVEAMTQLQAPLGVYFVLGNHDYRAGRKRVIKAFEQANLNLLLNTAVQLKYRDCRIGIAGIDYAEKDRHLVRLVRHACTNMPDDDLRILLAHHPHAFDPARRYHVDLTLSGHTHGGQFLLRKPRRDRQAIGLGRLAWRYHHGHYSHGQHRLFVSNGVGSSFPLRFRCPAEISILELHPA